MIGIGFLICVFGIGIINLLLPSKKSQKRKTADCSKSRSFQSARLLPGAIWISMRSIRPISYGKKYVAQSESRIQQTGRK